jgi:AcrR family transcriptional regulator
MSVAAVPLPAPDRREAIIAAAVVLFGRYGYRRTSMDDLARETGIAKGTVYLYFKTKEEIFRALCQSLLDRVLAAAERAAAAEAPIAARLRGILEAKFGFFFELVHGSPHANELLSSKNRLSADLFEQADRAYLRLVGRTIAAAVARGELRPGRLGLSADAAADLLVASAHGLEVGRGGPPSPRVFRRRLDGLARMLVAGLGG